MTRAQPRVTTLSILLAALAIPGCGDDDACTAVVVHVQTGNSFTIDRVTAQLADKDESDCTFQSSVEDGESTYHCIDRGAGTYTVRVYAENSGSWEDEVDVPSNACKAQQESTFNVRVGSTE